MDVGAARRIIQEGKMPYSLGNGHLAFLKMKVVFFQQVAPQGAKGAVAHPLKNKDRSKSQKRLYNFGLLL